MITFREYDLLLILRNSTINVEFYSLSNTFYFIILCYIEQKIYLFLWRPAISSFKCPKKSGQQGSTRHLKVRMLKVNFSVQLYGMFVMFTYNGVQCSHHPHCRARPSKMIHQTQDAKTVGQVFLTFIILFHWNVTGIHSL